MKLSIESIESQNPRRYRLKHPDKVRVFATSLPFQLMNQELISRNG